MKQRLILNTLTNKFWGIFCNLKKYLFLWEFKHAIFLHKTKAIKICNLKQTYLRSLNCAIQFHVDVQPILKEYFKCL